MKVAVKKGSYKLLVVFGDSEDSDENAKPSFSLSANSVLPTMACSHTGRDRFGGLLSFHRQGVTLTVFLLASLLRSRICFVQNNTTVRYNSKTPFSFLPLNLLPTNLTDGTKPRDH